MGAELLAEYCTITPKNIPKVFIVNVESENPLKFEMEGNINEKNIIEYINKLSKREQTLFVRSEEIPKNKNWNFLILVGKNFRREVLMKLKMF